MLRALRHNVARRVEAREVRGLALQALLALEASADGLLAGDPGLVALRHLLCQLKPLRAPLTCAPAPCARGAAGAARVAGAGEIQAYFQICE